MRCPFPRKLIPIVAIVCTFSLLATATVSAQSFQPPQSIGTATLGADPDHAITLAGIERNELEPGQSLWYQVASTGSSPFGITLAYNPGNTPPPGSIQMRVDWQTPNGAPGRDWPGFYRVGEGTSSGFAQGVLYWLTSSQNPAIYDVEVVNNSTMPVGYAIAATGRDFPPPDLNPPPPMESVAPLESSG
jgi:hypothetical protein